MTVTPAGLLQQAAADPAANTWLAANAGSGKTRVLTDRVARLLLQGVEPQRVLCLTFTKAAASEMQNRLFDRLGAWAMKPDDDLRAALLDLGETELSAPRLARARQLFARAIEAPGGLRIQTIHSFSASILRRFPLEAGVAPGFAEMDDRSAKILRAEIVEEMADTLAPEAVQGLTAVHSGEDFTKFVDQITRHRKAFQPPLDQAGIWRLFGLSDGFDRTALLASVFLGDEADWLPDIVPALLTGLKTDIDAARTIEGLTLSAPDMTTLLALEGLLLTKGSSADPSKHFVAKIGGFPTKDMRKRLSNHLPRVETLMLRVEAARRHRVALAAAQKTLALHRFAAAFLPLYEGRKAARGQLDFDDLIDRAGRLLTDPALAPWVLYRLDGGLDHILVDEAQDTSPSQWRLIDSLTAELTAGEGAGTADRTLFVVGDKKQSIYSFQGADVAAFDRMKDRFAAQLSGGNPLVLRSMEHSFRSSPAILNVVDRTFEGDLQAALGGASRHLAFHDRLAGRVDIWPVEEKTDAAEPGPWYEPHDTPQPEDPQVRLARSIARWIKDTVDAGTRIPQVARNGGPTERSVHPGDFLILVQRRSPLFHEIIRACKALNLPIAGADRLKLAAELAVKDLAALLAFLDTPEDDLSLAAVLRSPLCGWSEDDLFRLAHGRQGYLWEALRTHPGHPETRAFLDDMRGQADFLRPYDLIERVLNRHDGRRRLLDRLGPEAEDGIDELLGQALTYETAEVPSLTGFLVWMQTDDVEVKRQLDGEGQRIRVMTVHGAKGLEAEIVILPDTADRTNHDRDDLYQLADGAAVWKVPAPESPEVIASERAARKAREAAERLRLLYVAMTRARCWLVAAAAGELTQADAWYTLIRAGIDRAGTVPAGDGVLRHAFGDWPGPALRLEAASRPMPLPDWLTRPAPEIDRATRTLSPSDLGGAKALPGEAALPEDEVRRRGTALHLLLERLPALPRADWPDHAASLIGDPALAAALLAEAQRVLDDPALAPLFAAGSLAEVGVAGDWNGVRLVGSIDRLVLAPGWALVVDFKSNAVVPASPDRVPEGILRQLGAYAHILAQVYPDRRIDTAILWTRAPALMPLDPDIVRAALARTPLP